MGLDQYIYRINPLSKEVAKKIEGKIVKDIQRDIMLFSLADKEAAKGFPFWDLGQVVTLKDEFLKREDLIRDLNPGGDISSVRWGEDEVIVYLPADSAEIEGKKISIATEEFEKKYISLEDVQFLALSPSAVYYWRKQWDLHEELQDVTGRPIDNLEFVRIPEEDLSDILEIFPPHDSEFFATAEDDSEIFYHPWW